MGRIGLLIAVLLLAGCASTVKDAVSEGRLDSWQPAASAVALTAPIALVSDTQFHESRGYPSPILQGSGDEFNEVTIRSAQQVIGADDILQRAIDMSGPSLLLHAGDAIDMSCNTEWARFERVMRSKGAPGPRTWVYTPGNHDGYLAGNLSTPPDEANLRPFKDDDWAKLCNAGMLNPPQATPLRKTDVIRAYLGLLGPGVDGGHDVRCNVDGSHCWAAHLSEDEPWESFIVQLVRMPAQAKDSTPIYALLLDSSNYRDLFGNESISSAGLIGGLLKGQLAAARRLTNKMKADARFFFIAHYPIGDWHLNDREQRAWQLLAGDPRSLNFIITSHTHDGQLAHHTADLGGIVELNTGSLADPPIYMRTLQFEKSGDGKIGFRSETRSLTEGLDCKGFVPSPTRPDLDYGVDPQRTAFSSLAKWNWLERLWHRLANATKDFRQREEEKHRELKFQLLEYADIVSLTFPATAALDYRWPPYEKLAGGEGRLAGAAAITDTLRELALCNEVKKDVSGCSIPRKENLLLALEAVYRESNDIPVDRKKAESMRLCMALAAAEASPSRKVAGRISDLHKRIDKPWSMQLSPPPTVK